jgi:hypothetical protein
VVDVASSEGRERSARRARCRIAGACRGFSGSSGRRIGICGICGICGVGGIGRIGA